MNLPAPQVKRIEQDLVKARYVQVTPKGRRLTAAGQKRIQINLDFEEGAA